MVMYIKAILKFSTGGKGTMKWVSGNIYTGEWQKDKRNGWGIMEYKTGDKYEGNWINNSESCRKVYLENGNEYNGSWKANERSGME
jgi:hypothetical protein